ncbi:hypothetical protein Ciccas_002612 [Cichlidogyrus casuarinus]|uniref:Uncharacterized protein n=1 Tax=Cichlidogyrus casuarinus TaxID=1844966 RepID=A0ABD2QH56_9PLAT
MAFAAEREQKLRQEERKRMRMLRNEEKSRVFVKETSRELKKLAPPALPMEFSHRDDPEDWDETVTAGYIPPPKHTLTGTEHSAENREKQHSFAASEVACRTEENVIDPEQELQYCLHYQAVYIRRPSDRTKAFLQTLKTEEMYRRGEEIVFNYRNAPKIDES